MEIESSEIRCVTRNPSVCLWMRNQFVGAGPAFLSDSLTRVPCPCLSGFWRGRAGIFVLRRLKSPAFAKERERPGPPIAKGRATGRSRDSSLRSERQPRRGESKAADKSVRPTPYTCNVGRVPKTQKRGHTPGMWKILSIGKIYTIGVNFLHLMEI
jgi:hypothetical protein